MDSDTSPDSEGLNPPFSVVFDSGGLRSWSPCATPGAPLSESSGAVQYPIHAAVPKSPLTPDSHFVV